MKGNRLLRLNSLLKEVIAEVIRSDFSHSTYLSDMTSTTKVEISPDLHHAKVFISVIASEEDKKKVIESLQANAGQIAFRASKKVVMRYFPNLIFKLDTAASDHMKIENILKEIEQEKKSRNKHDG